MKNLKCSIHELGTLGTYKYVVIFARHMGRWLFVKHKERTTWEAAGGHIEAGETPLEAAKRELFEESGALDFDIEPMCDYHVSRDGGASSGVLYFANIHKLGELPESEMECACLFDQLPTELTYPEIIAMHYEYLVKQKIF